MRRAFLASSSQDLATKIDTLMAALPANEQQTAEALAAQKAMLDTALGQTRTEITRLADIAGTVQSVRQVADQVHDQLAAGIDAARATNTAQQTQLDELANHTRDAVAAAEAARTTATTAAEAAKTATDAIRSAQNLVAAAEAAADSARIDATTAAQQATAAAVEATNAVTASTSAQRAADGAARSATASASDAATSRAVADTAAQQASSARGAADLARATADTATSTATAAQAAAAQAKTTADTAAAAAAEAKTLATAAQHTANTANNTAQNAVIQAAAAKAAADQAAADVAALTSRVTALEARRVRTEYSQIAISGALALNATKDFTVTWASPMPSATYDVRMVTGPDSLLGKYTFVGVVFQTASSAVIRIRATALLTLAGTAVFAATTIS